jgi:hypothetical protein
MSITTGFLFFLTLTVLLLIAVIITGFKAKRKVHLPLVAITVLSLCTAIYYAERLGTLYDLEASGRIYPIHLWIAKAATVSYILPLVSGFLTLKNPRMRVRHRWFAFLVVALTVAAAATGATMVWMSDPLPV